MRVRASSRKGTGEVNRLVEQHKPVAAKINRAVVAQRLEIMGSADIAQLQAKYGDDRMFEIVVSAALGASRNRLLAGLEALDQA